MKKYGVILIIVLIFAIGLISWGLHSKKSLDQIKQHATMVNAETMKITSLAGRYGI